MRKNAGLRTFKDAEKALRNGGVFYYKGSKLLYDYNYIKLGYSPYRCITQHDDYHYALEENCWNRVEQWEIEVPWEDNIGDGVLCWVWDDRDGSPVQKYIRLITSYNPTDKSFHYVAEGLIRWGRAIPLTPEEVEKYTRII
jgi:hypothetical protein